MDNQAGRTEYVGIAEGRIAYEVVGHGPLVLLSPGMADSRSTYRFLSPLISNAATASPASTCEDMVTPAPAGAPTAAQTPPAI
jgi:hypothetical protein